MPDGAIIDFWGFGFPDTAGNCVPQLPGPILGDPATTSVIAPGDTVEITLENELPISTSMIFPGQTDMTSTATGGIFIGEVAAAATETYSFIAGPAGTYLYESGRTNEPQVAMGLYGALIVGAADPFVDEVIVLSEIDPALNADVAANPTTFTYNLLSYHPTYWLLNGRGYGDPITNPNPVTLDPDDPLGTTSQPYSSLIEAAAGETVRVRYVNAGGLHHTMSVLHDLRQVVQERDAGDDPNLTDSIAVNVPSGQTTDVDIAIPVTASDGDRYPLFNRQMYLTNGGPPPGNPLHTDGGGGGMLTFIEVTGAAPPNVAPTAVDDSGAGYTVNQGGTLIVGAPGVLGNDSDGGDGPGPFTAVLDTPPTNHVGTFTLGTDGSFTYVHDGSATTTDSFTYHANDGAADSNIATVTITINPAPVILYLSVSSDDTLPGVGAVTDEDILSFNGTDYAMFFDGSAAGIPSGADIGGFAIVDADTILMSFDSPTTVPGPLSVDDSDIVQFDGTLGTSPVGTFSLFFDGSDVSLSADGTFLGLTDEDLDAFERLSPTTLVVSTTGNPDVPGVTGEADEDLLLCTGTFGSATTCTWTMYFDGSDVGLGDLGEDIDGAAVASNGDIYLSAGIFGFGGFSGSSISGADEDVFVCVTPTTGTGTVCPSGSIFFDGSSFGLGGLLENVDAIELP
jgi:VCBS repeat-containing protein